MSTDPMTHDSVVGGEALKPCPFCLAHLDTIRDYDGDTLYAHPDSDNCVLSGTAWDGDEFDAASWNRRSPSLSGGEWPDRLILRDTKVTADEGQRIYTTATGFGYEKREYIRADLVSPAPLEGVTVKPQTTADGRLEEAVDLIVRAQLNVSHIYAAWHDDAREFLMAETTTYPQSGEARLPCDVQLPPATVLRKGVRLSALHTALRVRGMTISSDDMESAATFLIERLDDFRHGSLGDEIEDACRDFDGHVSPAIERLREAALSAIVGSAK